MTREEAEQVVLKHVYTRSGVSNGIIASCIASELCLTEAQAKDYMYYIMDKRAALLMPELYDNEKLKSVKHSGKSLIEFDGFPLIGGDTWNK